ncbi:hypothetical protein [Burkholderia pseudomallei]|uniref:hypothetical protein n=1 Tax=Burkholderia pseudomallei TaxID=28450 RepID=UPI0038795D33
MPRARHARARGLPAKQSGRFFRGARTVRAHRARGGRARRTDLGRYAYAPFFSLKRTRPRADIAASR